MSVAGSATNPSPDTLVSQLQATILLVSSWEANLAYQLDAVKLMPVLLSKRSQTNCLDMIVIEV